MQRTATILACLFFCAASIAQQYPFVHYTPKDGLVNSRVKKAYQDSKGRLYFLTYGGLSVFDGTRFRNYTTNDGLVSNVVNDILEVGDDSLLIATNGKANINVLVKGKLDILTTTGVKNLVVNRFYRHDDGKIYLTSDDGLFILENKHVRALDVSLLTKVSRLAHNLSDITGVGNYLVLTTNEMNSRIGLFLYDILHNRICDTSLLDKAVLLVGKGQRNQVWISTEHKLSMLDANQLAKGNLSTLRPSRNYALLREGMVVNVSFNENAMWAVYGDENLMGKEIRRIDETGLVLTFPLPEPAKTPGLRHVLIDKENTMWLSNDGEGVFKIVSSSLLIFEKPFDATIRIDRAFCSNNVAWFNCYLGLSSSNKLFKTSQGRTEVFYSASALSPIIFYADDKKILGHNFSTIYQANIVPHIQKIKFRPIITTPRTDPFLMNMLVDPGGNLVLQQNSALRVWKKNKIVFELPIDDQNTIEGLCVDRENLLWVVKRYHGIDVFRFQPDNISNYLQLVAHFSENQITGSPRCFVIDTTGLLWIGTRDNGVSAYMREKDRLKRVYHFDIGEGLTDNFVTSLACDSMNNLIVGTQTGLDRIVFNPEKSWRIENLSKSSNFFAFIIQTWADANHGYALTNSGALLQFFPPLETRTVNTPQLLLEEMKVNAQTVAVTRQTFSFKENNISFFVAAPSFIDEKQVVFSYLLEGSGNTHWSDTSSINSTINLTSLGAGKYLLKVRAFFPSTSYHPIALSLPFEITPPWWQTLWMKLIEGLLIVGLLVIGIRFYYRRKLEKQKIELEKQQLIEKERTRIATDMHDDLGSGLSRIKFLSQSILNKKISDEMIKTELEKITTYSDEMSEKMGEIVWALNEKNDTLADLIAYTRSYAVEYLTNHNIVCEAQTPSQLPATFITGEMRRDIFLSVKECLHNIVKHAGATKVRFSIVLDGAMAIVIHDNGKGIDWEHRRAFSNGIENISRRMKEINGEARFLNDCGTKVSLTVPLTL
jgi:signal transduction histidine kinase